MILKANGFAVVKYNGLFSIFVLFALPVASDALKGPCHPSTKLPSLYTYCPVCPLGLCYSFSVSLSDFCWALLQMGISKFLPITAVYNFFAPFSRCLPIQAKHQIFFYVLKTSKSIQSLSSVANMSLHPQCMLTWRP